MVLQQLILWRGPILLLGVLASLLWPHVSTWSNQFILELCLATMGLVLLVVDLIHFAKLSVRHLFSSFLEGFILDDFLRALYDPETGIIPCMVGSFVGACTMYVLQLDDNQRTKLIQASLWTSEEEARSILLHPGGTKALLPESFQIWLDEGKVRRGSIDNAASLVIVETVEESTSDTSVSDDHNNSDDSPTASSPTMDERVSNTWECSSKRKKKTAGSDTGNRTPDSVCFEETRRAIPSDIPTDPTAVMFRILRDKAMEKVRPLFVSIPESKLEILGTVAAFGLCSQFLLRFRSTRSLSGSIGALLLSGTAFGAFSSVLLRQAVLGSIHDLDSFKLVSATMLSRSLQRFKNLITNNKWCQSVLSLIILSMIGRQRRIKTSKAHTRDPPR